MPRDSSATRARILDAAIEEFAQHGLAGARIDRIAAAAEANKRSIYVYFASKEGLFGAALLRAMQELSQAVPLTEDDLPGYAGRFFDELLAHPQALRLSLWRMLERPGIGPSPGVNFVHARFQPGFRPNADAIGKWIRVAPSEPANAPCRRVIGIARDLHEAITNMDRRESASIYVPLSQGGRLASSRAVIVQRERARTLRSRFATLRR